MSHGTNLSSLTGILKLSTRQVDELVQEGLKARGVVVRNARGTVDIVYEDKPGGTSTSVFGGYEVEVEITPGAKQ
jgi:hypothetical protein